ncbi:protein crumbs-like [Dendronephthya gigantea]|uniref:protein crumbs-like n=1 Tax=Dendronephthya gigantea TaxID=151771 RepID=UPI00106B135A|nr:protein crumbs-like [Dendronephthya gigantea]
MRGVGVFTLLVVTIWQLSPVEGSNGTEIEYIFYSNATHISYVSIDGGESKALVKTPSATLSYDELNYRLWYYKDGEKLYNSNLDGSDLKNVSVPSNFGPFAVDAANQRVYYLTKTDFNLKLIDYDGNDLPDIGVSPDDDFRDLQIDTHNRSIFFTTDLTNSRNLIRYSLADGTHQTLHSGVPGIGTHLALDIMNKTVYWILFTAETNYKILKTTYDGQTSQIGTDQSGSITTVDIADGNGYYYILDTTESRIDKYNKSSDKVATTISLSTEATRMIVVSDKDHCALNNMCPANSTCTNSPGTIVCSCDTGFTGNQTYCQDIDECLNSPCGYNTNCTNTFGSYICKCQAGYEGNGTNCTDIDECLSNPCGFNANCTNTGGSYLCECISGYEGNGTTNCTDINECLANPCDVNANCTNNDGSYDCTCHVGYEGNGTSCSDVNECEMDPCGFNSNCTNTNGSFICECQTGFEGSGVNCTDIDECQSSPCGYNANCTNIVGSYECECKTGYTGNGTNCTDINECQTNPCDGNANCTNNDGSYLCTCHKGYSGNGASCTDIDECAEGNPCGFNTNCMNTNGSYTCECLSGFEGNGTNCTDINECERNASCHTNATCTNVPGSFYCACKANYSGDGFFCEVLTCKVEALYYATTDAIKGVFSDGNTTVTILSATDVKLNYDSGTKRLLYYDGTSLITVKLDGSNATTIASLTTISRFTVDHITRKVYYVTGLFKSLNVIDLNTGNTAGLNPTDIANVDDLDSDPDNSSLVLADSTRGDIVRYFLDNDTNEVVYHNDTSPKYLTVDPQYKVIYWIDYIDASDSYSLMKTYFNGSTSEVKFYPGTTSSVNVAIGKDNFYAMDSTRKRIDVFDRPTATFQDSFFLSDSPQEITVVEDLDECCVGGYCHDNATCTNTPGSYFCTCKEGYTGIGTNCEGTQRFCVIC